MVTKILIQMLVSIYVYDEDLCLQISKENLLQNPCLGVLYLHRPIMQGWPLNEHARKVNFYQLKIYFLL